MAKQKLTETEALKIFEDLRQQPAQLTQQEMTIVDLRVSGEANADAVTRRVGLASLTRTGAQLIDAIETDRAAAVAMAHVRPALQSYAEKLRTLADLMTAADTRIMIALCAREDMNEIEQEAAHG